MALCYEYPLTNSKGLNRVVLFKGLEFPILVTPTLHGEPLLTAQAFYYLSGLDSAVRIRFDSNALLPVHESDEELERIFEYIIDNYLFEYSKRHPIDQLTSKITDFKYWKRHCFTYHGYDENKTLGLSLDSLNDLSVLDISNEDFPDKGYWLDWNLVSNYTNDYIDTYVKSMESVIGKTVKVRTNKHDELGSGFFELPILQVEDGILNYHQARMLEVLQPDEITCVDGKILVSRGFSSEINFTLPLEVITSDKYYDADLLSYYFAAIRESLPISRFRCFYNVLEYFFEDAPLHLREIAKVERDQLSTVVRWATNSTEIIKFINTLGSFFVDQIRQEMQASSGVKISGLDILSPDLDHKLSIWLYEIRCAIVHSKKTRKGCIQARFVPYSDDEELAAIAIPIVQNIAILCIEKDSQLNNYKFG